MNGVPKNKNISSALVPIAIVVLISVALTSASLAFGSSRDKTYMKNESGLTYGSLLDVEEFKDTPDLVLVEMENGVEGYIYYSDLEEAEKIGVNNPEEAVAYMKEKEQLSAELLSEEINKDLATEDEITIEEARAFLDSIEETGESDAAASELSKDSRIAKNSASEIIDDAYYRAQKRIAKVIPVYEVDGVTVIGEFYGGTLF